MRYYLTAEIRGYIDAPNREAAEVAALRVAAFDRPQSTDAPLPFEWSGGEVVALTADDGVAGGRRV